MKIISNHGAPLSLEGGIVLGAAGAEGSVLEVDSISENDKRRYVDRGLIRVVEETPARPVRRPIATKEAE